ncbi:hypothetical protein F4802DRAFT_590225 [Xylaria palmicola]|nr:hypothetical protein F4802DRAFT_590225 [Xylaria palmicola]
MGAGLDELIESLLTEIAFSGVRGCSVSSLLAAIGAFYRSSKIDHEYEDFRFALGSTGRSGDEKSPQAAKNPDFAVASKVWRWLATRPDVSIGANRAYNHLSLEDVLALPEEEEEEARSSGATVKSPDEPSTNTQVLSRPRPNPRPSSDAALTVRPRLLVSEERQWRTIAGHGPDLKRVPLFEWRALVDIASVKDKGILQGDLVRLTGQDKRSLPTRTDALARKGYIIKQPIVLRGGKSSKLWLAQFAEHAREHQEREGLDYEKLDLSKAALTSDLHPVPFCDKWNGDTIDYLALAQAFVAIVKAWALIRYCDARAKLGVEERVRQMRALAKTCRWLTNIGALSFVGAKFAGSNRLFKDCVKFIRDPSPAEWSHFRATPKTRMVVPSGRIGKRGEASRAVHASQSGDPKGKATSKKPQRTKARSDPPSYTTIIPAPWKPQKPMPNTAFEIIKRAGPKGTSNAAICRQTLGHNYRRLTAAMTGSISMPTNSQPQHLKHLSSTSQLSRIGKTMTYTFYANSEIAEGAANDKQAPDSSVDINAAALVQATNDTTGGQNYSAFSQPDLGRFSTNPSALLTEIARTKQSNRASGRPKRNRPIDAELDDQPPVKIPRRLGRRPARRLAIDDPSSELIDEHHHSEIGEIPSPAKRQYVGNQLETSPQAQAPRPPGVYRGLPNSLDPVIKRKGRRRKSLVLIFRSDRLKDPSFLGLPTPTPEVGDVDGSTRDIPTEATPRGLSVQNQDTHTTDTPIAPVTSGIIPSEGSPVSVKRLKPGKNGSFWCQKCGNSWKNSNGLEYHLSKSRTTCNPDFVPPSAELINHRKRKATQPQVLERPPASRLVSEEHGQARSSLTPKEQVESRFERKKRRRSPCPQSLSSPMISSLKGNSTYTPHTPDTSQSRDSRGKIVLKDLQVYNATDHRWLSHKRKSDVSRDISANGSASTPDPRLTPAFGHSSKVAFSPSGRVYHMDVHTPDKQNLHCSSRAAIDEVESRIQDQGFATTSHESVIERANMSSDNSPIPMSIDFSGRRRPLPNKRSIKSLDTGLLAPTPIMEPHGSQVTTRTITEPATPVRGLDPLPDSTIAQSSTHKSLASFARPTRPNASFGARRRDRSMQIIEYLLERNEGVFPGLRSLFMAVISVWAKEFSDLAPPDRRICQNIVNQMERDGVLKQMHFFFFDDQAKMQECVVLAKANTNTNLGVDSSDDPRVIAVKEKMREMFPEAYVPDAFSLSPDEAKLFDELASQGKEHSQARSLRAPRDLKTVQHIETLRYENSVMGDISIHRSNTKRQVDDVHVEAHTPSKRTRTDLEQPDSIERTRKPRRRPDKHEMWDSGKLAVYIWSQRQKPGAMWDQHPASLQDPVSGAWSWTPETDTSQLGSITTILSSVKSARHIDASLKRKGRRTCADINTNTIRNKEEEGYGNRNNRQVPIDHGHLLITDDDDPDSVIDPVLRAQSSMSYAAGSLVSNKDPDDIYEESSELSDNENAPFDTSVLEMSPLKAVRHNNKAPRPETRYSLSTESTPPSTLWFSDEPLPDGIQDMLKTIHRVTSFKSWADPAYGEFLRNLKITKKWEQSADGIRALTRETTALDHVYINLTVDQRKANLKPIDLEWLVSNQFTSDSIPEEVKNVSPQDEEYGLSYLIMESEKKHNNKGYDRKSEYKKNRKPGNGNSKLKAASQGLSGRFVTSPPEPSTLYTEPEGFIEYKTRDLTVIPKQPRGRFNKPAAHDDKLGSKREDELIAACIVFRTLLGGLDRNLDIGLLLKHFPGMSLSAIKKFWPRISRERKSFVQALTAKFQSEFLVAYESGKLPQLDYDNIESYDWPKLILWATQLETHEEVDLPESREILHQRHQIEDAANEAVDWREIWFATTSTYNRIEAVASETMSIPLPPKHQQEQLTLERARTWVRSICCTPLKDANVKDKLIPKLLELGQGDAAETNQILEKAATQLNREKVITRTKGKDIGGNFRIHGIFSKQLEKVAGTSKFRQAISFKDQLDEVFRGNGEFIMPYAADDGSIMAALNLQAHGRIRIDTTDMPHIPFGFEPGNYEGRTFPKSYYHFKVRLVPTETYLFNADMALLKQARQMEPPTQGPNGKLPIWVDFFGKLNVARWADYVSMIAFTLATKGPVGSKMCVTLLKPMVEEFEIELIVEWLDKLGLVQRAVDGCGVTGAEWWWLVAGHIVQMADKST